MTGGETGAMAAEAAEPRGGRTDAAGRNLTFAMLDALGRAIVTGEYETRRFPTEAELATRHAVSRSVTREAVKMLTAKGLLTAGRARARRSSRLRLGTCSIRTFCAGCSSANSRSSCSASSAS